MQRLLPALLLLPLLAPALAEDVLPAGAAAVVNGEAIPLADLERALRERHGAEMLRELILRRIVEQEARRTGIQVREEEILRRTGEALRSFQERAGAPVDLGNLLKAHGITEAQFREQVSTRLVVEKLVLRERLCGAWAEPRILYASTEERAKALLARLRAGEDFGALAKAESVEAASAARDGRLGTVFRGDLPPELEGPAFSLPLGEVSGILKTPVAFALLKVEARQEARDRPYAEIRDELDRRLESAPPEEGEVDRYVLRLRRAARIASAPGLDPFPKPSFVPFAP